MESSYIISSGTRLKSAGQTAGKFVVVNKLSLENCSHSPLHVSYLISLSHTEEKCISYKINRKSIKTVV